MCREVCITKEFRSDTHAMINKLHKVLSFKMTHTTSYNVLNYCGCQFILYLCMLICVNYLFNVTNMHSFSDSNE